MIARLGSGVWVEQSVRQPCSLALNQKLTKHISIKGCSDAAFGEKHAAFIAWYPQEIAA